MQNSYRCGSIFGATKVLTPFHEPRPKLHESIGRQKKTVTFYERQSCSYLRCKQHFFLSLHPNYKQPKANCTFYVAKKKRFFFLLFSLNFSTQILTNDKNEFFFSVSLNMRYEILPKKKFVAIESRARTHNQEIAQSQHYK